MKCEEARNILNSLLDEGTNSHSSEALSHIETCGDCRTWHSETQAVLGIFDGAFEDTAVPDIATSVMASLPERHPCSTGRSQQSVRRLLPFVAYAWISGISILAMLWIAVSRWFASAVGPQMTHKAQSAIGQLCSLKSLIDALVAVIKTATSFITTVDWATCHFSPLIVQFTVIDSLVLLAIALIWRGRIKGIVGSLIVGI